MSLSGLKRTGFVQSERYYWHDTLTTCGSETAGIRESVGRFNQPLVHFENQLAKRRMANLIAVCGLEDDLVQLKPRECTLEELEYFHEPAYHRKIKALSDESGGDAGDYAPFGAGSFEIAKLAAGGIIVAIDAVLDGVVDNAYVLCR
jgi:acetoin utilization deacetylase AcuC-like enzyme